MPWACVHIMPIREQIRRPTMTTNRGLHFLKTADVCIYIAGDSQQSSSRCLADSTEGGSVCSYTNPDLGAWFARNGEDHVPDHSLKPICRVWKVITVMIGILPKVSHYPLSG